MVGILVGGVGVQRHGVTLIWSLTYKIGLYLRNCKV